MNTCQERSRQETEEREARGSNPGLRVESVARIGLMQSTKTCSSRTSRHNCLEAVCDMKCQANQEKEQAIDALESGSEALEAKICHEVCARLPKGPSCTGCVACL